MPASPTVVAIAPQAQANADVVLRLFAEVLSGRKDVALVDELLSPDYVDHDPDSTDTGRTCVGAKLVGMWQALPGAEFEPEIVVAADDLVCVHSSLVSGDSRVGFADVYRVRDATITEHWHVVDTAALGALFGAG